MSRFKRVKIKTCLLGDPAVGKTSLIQKYIYNFFGDTYMRTLGTKVSRKVVNFTDEDNDIEFEITMMIWDIMGQKFSSMPLDKYLKMSQGALIVCDITRVETFKSLIDWKETLFKETGPIPVIYLANKIDLEKERAIKISEFEKFAQSENVDNFVTSAKTGQNVNNAFLKLGELVVNKITEPAPTTEAIIPTLSEAVPTRVGQVSQANQVPVDQPINASPEPISASFERNKKPMNEIYQTTKDVMEEIAAGESDIKPGIGYIIREEKPERSFKIFQQLINKKIRGLCITRSHPERVKQEYQLDGIQIWWLSTDSPKKENVLVPTFLPQLNTLIIDFIQKYNDVVILLEGIEYLIDQNDFKAVLSLIHSLNDYIMGSNARLIIPLDPLILKERELHMLSRDFKIL